MLIRDKVKEAKAYSNVQQLAQTQTGMDRIVARINDMILKEGKTDIDGAIASVESELTTTVEQ